MMVTMLEAEMVGEQGKVLVEQFTGGGGALPPQILESFVLQEEDGGMWRIVTVWKSETALHAYQASVETPGGFLMFRAAGAEPTLTVWEVASRLHAKE